MDYLNWLVNGDVGWKYFPLSKCNDVIKVKADLGEILDYIFKSAASDAQMDAYCYEVSQCVHFIHTVVDNSGKVVLVKKPSRLESTLVSKLLSAKPSRAIFAPPAISRAFKIATPMLRNSPVRIFGSLCTSDIWIDGFSSEW